MQRTPITREGYDRLLAELQRLQKEERPAIIKAIEEARGHGDLSENAEYEAAKDKQGLIEGRIKDLTQKLSECEIVEPSEHNSDGGRAIFGRTVVMEDLETGDVARYRLVGPYEADVQAGTISVTSPLGKALIGKEEGAEVQVQTPKGKRMFEILEVQA
ncbi:MAG: transcription elongation factor GreA [Syntrophobacteraceae bacterium]|jgi:transcription elongation factor GreA|nr:transcription elongation factor GreA [Syntrophobacteraceae bacterium]